MLLKETQEVQIYILGLECVQEVPFWCSSLGAQELCFPQLHKLRVAFQATFQLFINYNVFIDRIKEGLYPYRVLNIEHQTQMAQALSQSTCPLCYQPGASFILYGSVLSATLNEDQVETTGAPAFSTMTPTLLTSSAILKIYLECISKLFPI